MQEVVQPEEVMPLEGLVCDAVVGEIEGAQARQVEEDFLVEEVDLVVVESEFQKTPPAAVRNAARRHGVVDLKHRIYKKTFWTSTNLTDDYILRNFVSCHRIQVCTLPCQRKNKTFALNWAGRSLMRTTGTQGLAERV